MSFSFIFFSDFCSVVKNFRLQLRETRNRRSESEDVTCRLDHRQLDLCWPATPRIEAALWRMCPWERRILCKQSQSGQEPFKLSSHSFTIVSLGVFLPSHTMATEKLASLSWSSDKVWTTALEGTRTDNVSWECRSLYIPCSAEGTWSPYKCRFHFSLLWLVDFDIQCLLRPLKENFHSLRIRTNEVASWPNCNLEWKCKKRYN